MDPLQNQIAPDFTLTGHDGTAVTLSDLRGQRVILYFYPKADTPGCTLQACEFRDLQPEIRERGVVVLGVSPDPVEKVRAFHEKYSLPFTLLADADHRVSEAYGVWKEKQMFGKDYWGVERSTFLIDEDGRVEQVFRRVDPQGHAAELLHIVEQPSDG